jgi:hypothetical protein
MLCILNMHIMHLALSNSPQTSIDAVGLWLGFFLVL